MTLGDKLYLSLSRISWRFSQNTSKTIRLNVDGQIFKVPMIYGAGRDNVYYQNEKLYPIIKPLTRYKRGAFVDIGANIGQMLVVLMLADKQIPYAGFEPNLLCCSYIDKLIQLNELSNHAIYPYGLSDSFSAMDLMFNGKYDVCASTTPMFRPQTFFENKKKILLAKGDDVLPKVVSGNIGIVKIDVEGSEVEVINGLRDTLETQKPVVLFEVLPYKHIAADTSIFAGISNDERMQIVNIRKQRITALEEVLTSLGYIWQRIEDDGKLTSTKSLDSSGPEQRTEMNFLAIHASEQIAFGNHFKLA